MEKYLIPTPSKISVENYLEAVKVYNILNQNQAKEKLSNYFPEINKKNSKYSIITTGSDGRLEKSNLSKIEIILVYKDILPNELNKKKLENFCKENQDMFQNIIEVKNLNTDFVSFFNQEPKKVYPSRGLDAKLLIGNENIFKNYKNKMYEELLGPEGKKIIKKFDEKKKWYRSVTKNQGEKNKGLVYFDIEKGELYYDNNRVKSTKYSHLRTIQYKIASDIFKALRRDIISIDFIKELPEQTIERLNFFKIIPNISNIGSIELDDLISTYKKVLYWYHLSEENYHKNNKNITYVDKNELKKATEITLKFAYKDSIFK